VHIGLIVGAFMVGQAVEGYVLQPLLLGDKIGLSPLWVIFAVLAGAQLAGIVGMLIALPLASVINVLARHAYQSYQEGNFYRGDGQLSLFPERTLKDVKQEHALKEAQEEYEKRQMSLLDRIKAMF